MTTDNRITLKKLFTKLIDDNDLQSYGLNSQQILQFQGQIEESLGLLKDVVDELQTIDPETVSVIKALTLEIFE
ncbi:MAG: hypothetical protein AB4372_21540 [Xenococcus sp. (in: cyanobacteria)]